MLECHLMIYTFLFPNIFTDYAAILVALKIQYSLSNYAQIKLQKYFVEKRNRDRQLTF